MLYEIDHRKLMNAMILVKCDLYAYLDLGLFLLRVSIIHMRCIHRQKIVQRSGIRLFRLFGGRHCLRLITIKRRQQKYYMIYVHSIIKVYTDTISQHLKYNAAHDMLSIFF